MGRHAKAQKQTRWGRIELALYSILTSLLMLLVASPALAQGTGMGPPAPTTTLGDVICNVASELKPYGDFISAVAYLAGVFLIAGGFFQFRQHSDNPNQVPVSRPVAMLVGGAACLALPTIASVFQTTVVGSVTANGAIGCAVGAVTNITTGSSTDISVMFTNLFNNIANPMQGMLSVICFVVGTFFIAKGLMRAAKYGTDARACSVHVISAYLVIGAILFSIGTMTSVLLYTLFGIDAPTAVSGFHINWAAITSDPAGTDAIDKVIQSILTFVQVIGLISFLRGWMIIKSSVEGSGNATIAQGVTHIIGGTMAMNIVGMAQIFNKTFGLDIIV